MTISHLIFALVMFLTDLVIFAAIDTIFRKPIDWDSNILIAVLFSVVFIFLP